MANKYLDYNGISYFWTKLKSYFIKGNTGGVFYGTCPTAAGTAAKTVTCNDFTADNLKAGAIIIVTFTATNSGAVASLTMNVNSTGAKPIKYINNGSLGNLTSAGYLKTGVKYPFYYDGANWVVWFNYNTTYSALSEADMKAGTATTARTITAQRLKEAVEYHAPVKSVNGSTGDVTVAVPTKTSDLTNDSGFITSAPVTSVNGQTGAVTIDVPTYTSDLTNDGDGENPFVTRDILSAYVQTGELADILATPKFYACDSTTKAVLQQAFGISVDICVPEGVISQEFLLYFLEPRTWFAWMNGTELEFARLSVKADTSTGALTLVLRGNTSVASGVMGVDSTWTVTLIDGYYEASWTATESSATGTQLTDSITVPKGTYLISVASPYVQGAMILAGIRVNSATDIGSMISMPTGMYTKASFIMTFSSDSTIYALTQSAASATFANTNRGGLKLVRLI